MAFSDTVLKLSYILHAWASCRTRSRKKFIVGAVKRHIKQTSTYTHIYFGNIYSYKYKYGCVVCMYIDFLFQWWGWCEGGMSGGGRYRGGGGGGRGFGLHTHRWTETNEKRNKIIHSPLAAWPTDWLLRVLIEWRSWRQPWLTWPRHTKVNKSKSQHTMLLPQASSSQAHNINLILRQHYLGPRFYLTLPPLTLPW